MAPDFVIGGFFIVLAAFAILNMFAWGQSKKEKPPDEPAGPGLQRNTVREVISQGDEEIVVFEEHTLSGIADSGQIVNIKTNKHITLDCGHPCRDAMSYGGRCDHCKRSFCSSPQSQCFWVCNGKCRQRLCRKHERNEAGKCKTCAQKGGA